MKNQTVVNRYARALLGLGLADGEYGRYGLELQGLAESLAALGAEAEALVSPCYPAGIRRKMLDLILARAALSPMVTNFVRLLMDKDHLERLGEVAVTYNALADAEKGLLRARLTSASPLNEAEIEAVKTSLSRFSGRRVELTVDQDPGLIGGMVARLGDLVIDGSVRTQLGRLSASLESLN
jgi:F-type H+-transporting ATPase subunit delta